jgi:hypothetical protein
VPGGVPELNALGKGGRDRDNLATTGGARGDWTSRQVFRGEFALSGGDECTQGELFDLVKFDAAV